MEIKAFSKLKQGLKSEMSSDYVTTKYILVLESPMSFSHMHTGIYEICGTNLSSMKILFSRSLPSVCIKV